MVKNLKEKIRQRLIAEYRHLFSEDNPNISEITARISRILEELASHEQVNVSHEDKEAIITEIVNDIAGFGPIDSLMRDSSVSEIMINGPQRIYVERNGKKELSNLVFDDQEQLMYLVHKLISPTRRRVDESYPFSEISLKDGTRVNIVIAPVALNGPVLTIRKFLKQFKTIEDLVKMGTMNSKMAEFLIACIRGKVNIIFSGATGVGKTTTLNVLSSYIDPSERIITIEDTAELVFNQDHVVRLETRQSNIEGKGEITIRDLFKNSLRMRPGRIIIGEIRGSEALDMLQGICSGHTGSMSVIHADSPQDVVYRLETMLLTSGVPIKMEAIHRQIAAAIEIIVQQDQMYDGSRRVTRISQIHGLKDGQVVVEDLFTYDIEGIDQANGLVLGQWKASGIKPAFYLKFKKYNVTLSEELFNKG